MSLTAELIHIAHEKADALIKFLRNSSKTSALSVSAAIVLTLLYTTFQKFNRPARKLSHLPYVSFVQFLNYSIRDKIYEVYSRELVMPKIKQSNGIYMVKNTRK